MLHLYPTTEHKIIKENILSLPETKIKTHLVKLELIAPKDIIKHTNFLIESIEDRITPLVTIVGFEGEVLAKGRDPRNPVSITNDPRKHYELDALDENLKMQCEKLAELFRKDLGVSKK